MRNSWLFAVIGALVPMLSMQEVALADGLATYHSCGGRTDPNPDEVFIYQDIYSGTCAALYVGWYPYSGTGQYGFGLPNDAMSSFKAGSNVRVKLWLDWIYGQGNSSTHWCAWNSQCSIGNQNIAYNQVCCYGSCMSWNDGVSSIEVMSTSRDEWCGDLQPGEFAVFSSSVYNGNEVNNCAVLKYPSTNGSDYVTYYPDPQHMGVANDSIKWVDAGPVVPVPPGKCYYGGGFSVNVYKDTNYRGGQYGVGQGWSGALPSNWVRVTSSIQARVECNMP